MVAVFLLLVGFFFPQVSIIGHESTGLSTSKYLPSQISNNVSYSVTLPYNQVFYGFPFTFSKIDYNDNHVVINGVNYSVHTEVKINSAADYVTITEWVDPPVSSGSIVFIFNFEAAYVLHYDGFDSSNFLHGYYDASHTFYFTKNTTNWQDVAIGAILLVIGAVLFVKRK